MPRQKNALGWAQRGSSPSRSDSRNSCGRFAWLWMKAESQRKRENQGGYFNFTWCGTFSAPRLEVPVLIPISNYAGILFRWECSADLLSWLAGQCSAFAEEALVLIFPPRHPLFAVPVRMTMSSLIGLSFHSIARFVT